jgi:hypothetical protein
MNSNRLYSFLVSTLLTVGLAFTATVQASPLDSLKYSEIVAMDMAQLEKIYLEDTCPDMDQCGDFATYQGNRSSDLTLAQRLAVYNYTLAMFDIINPALYSGVLSGQHTGYVRVLDAALKKLPSISAVVYRGAKFAHLKVSHPGDITTLLGYTSTSTIREKAEDFVKDCLMKINIRSGKDVSGFSNKPDEAELLLPRGIRLRVDKIETKEIEIFGEEGPEMRTVKIVELTQI